MASIQRLKGLKTWLKDMVEGHHIETVEQLEALYGEPMQLALDKEVDTIIPAYRAFIEKAPFVVVGTGGPDGFDCSPRGDGPGFVRVADEKTVLIPDRRGNNRLDTLKNIVRDGRIALLFLVPGVGETMRINGTAALSADPALCASFAVKGKAPATVIVVTVESVYVQCSKALVRSKLWDADAQVARTELPSMGDMIKALADDDFDSEAFEANYPKAIQETLY